MLTHWIHTEYGLLTMPQMSKLEPESPIKHFFFRKLKSFRHAAVAILEGSETFLLASEANATSLQILKVPKRVTTMVSVMEEAVYRFRNIYNILSSVFPTVRS